MHGLWVDVRSAWRGVTGNRSAFAAVVVTFALGMGLTTATFAAARAVLLRPLPYSEPDRLAMIWRAPKERASVFSGFRDEQQLVRQLATAAQVREWRSVPGAFADMAAVDLWQGNPSSQIDLLSTDGAERLRGALATPNVFAVLGVTPSLGNLFVGEDEQAILSDGLWRRRFGADPTVVGRLIDVAVGRDRQRRRVRVAGVLPADFKFTYPDETELWMALPWSAIFSGSQYALTYRVVARLAPGASLSQAASQLRVRYEGQEETAGTPPERRTTVWLEPIHEFAVGRTRPAVILLGTINALLLIVTSLTAATLLIAQNTRRAAHLAMMQALGASRWRIRRQLVVEALLFGVTAGTAALAIVWQGQALVAQLLPQSIPRGDEVRIDLATATMTYVLAVAAAGIAGVLGAANLRTDGGLQVLRGRFATDAQDIGRLWAALITSQVALVSCLLLVGGVLLQTLWNLQKVALGFDPTDVIVVEMRLTNPRYRDPLHLEHFQEEVLTRLRSLPGVEAVGATSSVPMRGVDFARLLRRQNNGAGLMANERLVGADYFRVLRIPLLRGRLLSGDDTANAPRVAVISQTLAASLFPDADAIGQVLPARPPATIVGIVGDIRALRVDSAGTPAYYLPRAQAPAELFCLVVRTRPAHADVARQIAPVVNGIDPEQPVQGLRPLADLIGESYAERALYAFTATAFSLTTLVLASIALSGLLAQSVSRRRRELGVRLALGATPIELAAGVIASGMRWVAAGLVLGLAVSGWVVSLMARFLFEVPRFDPVTYGAVAGVVTAVGLMASWLPSRVAAATDVLTSLRCD